MISAGRTSLLPWRVVAIVIATFAVVAHFVAGAGSSTWERYALFLLVVVSIVSVVVAREAWRDAVGFALVYACGQASWLLLLQVEPFAVYQHLALRAPLTPARLLALSLLALQLLVSAVGFVRMPLLRAQVIASVRRHPIGALALLGIVAFSSAVPTRDLPASALEVVLATGIQLLAATTLALSAWAIPADRVGVLRDWCALRVSLPGVHGEMRAWDRRVPAYLAAFAAAAATVIARFAFDDVPHIDDSVSYLFHAKVFATGALSLPAPPDSAAFHVDEVLITGGRWFGYGFPGWPALLSLGVRGGVPWLVNPLLAALTVWLAHAYVERESDRGTAHVVAALLALSPWLWFMSGEYMPHPLSAALSLAAIVAAMHGLDHAGAVRGSAWFVLAGVALGGCALVRPLDAALAAAFITLLFAWNGRTIRNVFALAQVAVVSAAVSVVVLPYDRLLTGKATYTPQMMWTDRRWGVGSDRLGFGADIGIRAWDNIDPLPGHGVIDVFMNLNKNLFVTQADLFGWVAGSLLLAYLLVTLRSRSSPAALERGALAWVMLFVVGYSAYWFSGGPDLGSRYWYPAIVPLVILTVAGARRLSTSIEASLPQANARIAGVTAVATMLALLTYVPSQSLRKYRGYRGIDAEIRTLASRAGLRNALVFVDVPERETYQSAFNLNELPLGSGAVVYARRVNAESVSRVLSAFPGRDVWQLQRPSPDAQLTLTPMPRSVVAP